MEKVDRALADARNTIDSYIAGRYTLPLSTVPQVLTRIACELARYYLYDDQITDTVKQRYDANIKFLVGVASGDVKLGVDAESGVEPAGGAGRAVHGRPHLGSPLFGRVSLMVQATIRFEGQKGLDAALSRLAVLGRSPRPIFKAIANYGESSTRLRFEHQRGPDGATEAQPPSQKSGGQTLVKSRRLLRSITNAYGENFAAWGSNVAYARIHQLGGEISRAASTRIRLRTDPRGNLVRQPAIASWRCSPATVTSVHARAGTRLAPQDPHASAPVRGRKP